MLERDKNEPVDIKRLAGLKKNIRASILIIAEERDKLREFFDDLEDIKSSIDEAALMFEQGLDELSQFI